MLSDEERRRIEEEEIHRHVVRERLAKPKRRRRWILGACAILLLLAAWFGWTILEEAGRMSATASAQDMMDRMRAYETAAAVAIEQKSVRGYDGEKIRPRIAPFSVQAVGQIEGAGRYRVVVTYEMFGGQEHAIYAVRCSSGLCNVEF